MTALDLTDTYLLIGGDRVERIEGGGAFWERLATDDGLHARVGDGWLTGIYPIEASWTSWEMHPDGDEIVHATEGRFDVILDTVDGQQAIEVVAGRTIVIPAGTWHTIDVVEPGATLHVTFGRNTQHRPR